MSELNENNTKNNGIAIAKWWPYVLIGCMMLPVGLLVALGPQHKNEDTAPIAEDAIALTQPDETTPENPKGDKAKEAKGSKEDKEDKEIKETREEKEKKKNQSPGSYLASVFARSQNDNSNAAQYIQRSLSTDPKNLALKEQLYHVLLVEGNFAEAFKIARAIKDRPHHRSMAAPLLLAIEQVKQQQYTEALTQLGAKDMKGNLNALVMPLMTAWVKMGAGMIHAPIHVKDVLGKDGSLENTFITYHLALMNDLMGYDKEAADYYAKSMHDPDKTPFRIIEAAMNFYLRTGRTEEYRAITSSTRDKSMITLLARSNGYAEGNNKLARIVTTPQEGVAELLYSVGSILFGVNALEDEAIYMRLALYLKPDFSAAQYLLGGGLEQAKDLPRAIQFYNAINKKSPLYFRGQIRSAEALFAEGDKTTAYSILEMLEQTYPDIPEVLLTKADLLRDDKRYLESADTYSKVISSIKNVDASDWIKYYSRGIVYERAGQWDKAEADFNMALKLEPDQPDVLNYLGYSLLTFGKDLPRAKALIQRALEQRPDDMHIVDSMGWALYTAGEFDQALSYMEQAVELAPNDPTVMDHLGDVYFRLGRKKEARFQWERALIFKPDDKLKGELQSKIDEGLAPFVPPDMPLSAEDHGKKVE